MGLGLASSPSLFCDVSQLLLLNRQKTDAEQGVDGQDVSAAERSKD
jgi:hypothetical protein